jgi:formylglycine-generating enzyme required for sulfatase activity
MPTANRYPNFVRGVAAAGLPALRAAAGGLANWQLLPGARIAATADDAEEVAAEFLAALKYPEHVFDALDARAQDRVAAAVGVAKRAAWKPSASVPAGTPSYLRPSWEKDVYAVLFARAERAPADARVDEGPRYVHDAAWPELASVARWRATRDKARLAAALAAALGPGWKPAPPAGDHALARLRSSRLGVALVAIPGGTMEMGLSTGERRLLSGAIKGQGPEAAEYLRALAAGARPVRPVTVHPFLCSEAPLVERHGTAWDCPGDAANPHGVLRVDAEHVPGVLSARLLRLPSEAEWEWMARSGGESGWPDGAGDPTAWAAGRLATPLGRQEHRFGIRGLGWGEWVDDGWHADYRKARRDSAAWEPKTRPETVRGGAFDGWPWQVGGEALLCHPAGRNRAGEDAAHAVRPARDLPERG